MICSRMLLRCITGSSVRRYCRSRRIKKSISALGAANFPGKRVERQRRDVQPRARFNHRACRLDAGRWPAIRGRWRFCASAITVHDDGDMLRQAVRVQPVEQARFFAIFGCKQFGRLHVWNSQATFAGTAQKLTRSSFTSQRSPVLNLVKRSRSLQRGSLHRKANTASQVRNGAVAG